MSISFKTDHHRLSSGAHKYTITVETDIKRYFESIQQLARDCVDDMVELFVIVPFLLLTSTSGIVKMYAIILTMKLLQKLV